MSTYRGAAQILRDTFEKQAPIGQPRQRVVIGQIVQSLVFFDVIDAERDITGQLGQEHQFILLKELPLAGVQREHADGPARHDQRQHDHGVQAEADVRLPVLDAGVGLRVVGHDRSLLA